MAIDPPIIVLALIAIVFNIDTDSCMITHDAPNENNSANAPIVMTSTFNS